MKNDLTAQSVRKMIDEMNEVEMDFMNKTDFEVPNSLKSFRESFKLSSLPSFLDQNCNFRKNQNDVKNDIVEKVNKLVEKSSRHFIHDSLCRINNYFHLRLPWFPLIDRTFAMYQEIMETFPVFWRKAATESLISRLNEIYQIKGEFKDFSEIKKRLDLLRIEYLGEFNKSAHECKRVEVPRNKPLITRILVESAFTDSFKYLLLDDYNKNNPTSKITEDPTLDYTRYVLINFDHKEQWEIRRVDIVATYLFFLKRSDLMKKMFDIDVKGTQQVAHYDKRLLIAIMVLCSWTCGGRVSRLERTMSLSEHIEGVKNTIQRCFGA